jgi:chemotaxis protein MotB
MARPRARPTGFNIWPGFVDALTQLLMVIIFVLLVFTVSHFYLGYTLEGRDAAVARLNHQVSELADMLSVERASAADLKAETERLAIALDEANRGRDTLAGQLTALAAQREEQDKALALRTEERDTLARDLATAQEGAKAATEDSARLEAALAEAQRTVTADKETIETQLRDLARLARDIDALRTLRADLERRVANLSATLSATAERAAAVDAERARQAGQAAERAAALEAARSQAAELEKQKAEREAALAEAGRQAETLAAETESRAAEIARLEKQVRELASAVAEREARIRALADESGTREAEAKAAQKTVGELRDRSKELEARIADERERTLLAQRTIEENAVRLRALFLRGEHSERELEAERQSGNEARGSLQRVTTELEALKQELARLNGVLEASETKNRDQQVQIADLGGRLNQALASKVEELSRYRSEFFGRMRELLGDRPDVEIVGDRFVFPAEVLFAVGSPDLNDAGKARMASLAGTLTEIAAKIPKDIPWILRVDGHTDRTPVRSPQFRQNWDLSVARAVNVVQFLIEQGIPPNRLAAAGFGEFQPIDPGSGDAAYARNRRIEIKLTER